MEAATVKGYSHKSAFQKRKPAVNRIWDNREEFCAIMEAMIRDGQYKVGKYRYFVLRDRKKSRNISVLPFKDRCVQNDIKDSIEDILMRQMDDCMLGGLPDRGVLSTVPRYSVVRQMKRILKRVDLKYYIQADVKKFYDSIDNKIVMRILEKYIHDKRTLAIIKEHLFNQKRLAIGDPFSHLLANLVMSRLVRHIRQLWPGLAIVNYADDFFIASDSKDTLKSILREMKKFAGHRLRLKFKRVYIRPILESVPIIFCGFKYTRNAVFLTKRTKEKYIRSRHKSRSLGSYNGILSVASTKNLRKVVETYDNGRKQSPTNFCNAKKK